MIESEIPAARRATVEIVIPVYNEEADLEMSVRRLRNYLDASIPFETTVTIADNASTDGTWALAQRLSAELPGVRSFHLDAKGRGRALRAVWSSSPAEVVAYMDVDLSTRLDALLPLLAPLVSGHSDVAIGSRLARGARVVRGPRRELISRAYNLLLRAVLHNRFSDAQCGFKAARADKVRALLPAVRDEEWFFDTELLVLAERSGLRIHEVPVDWTDDPDSRVDVARTALADLRGVARLVQTMLAGGGRIEGLEASESDQVVAGARFAGIGTLSTLAYFALFLLLRPQIGAYLANALSLLACTVANATAHARVSFGRRGSRLSSPVTGYVALALISSLLLTSGALLAAEGIDARSLALELVALVLATAFSALIRFSVFKAIVFRTHLRRHDEVVMAPASEAGATDEGGSPPLGGLRDGGAARAS